MSSESPQHPPATVKQWFTEKNISSIGGLGKKNSKTTLDIIRAALEEKRTELESLMQETGFTPTSISSILSGAGKSTAEAVAALTSPETKAALKALMEEGLFDAKSISSILNGAGKSTAEAVAALTLPETKAALKALIEEGLFDASSISSILSGSGKSTAEAVAALKEHWPKLKEMTVKFRPTEIATRLNGKASGDLGKAIIDLHNSIKAELDGMVNIPPGSGAQLAAVSPVAAVENGRA